MTGKLEKAYINCGRTCSSWESVVDPESSEVDGYQKIGQYIPKGTVEYDHFNAILTHIFIYG